MVHNSIDDNNQPLGGFSQYQCFMLPYQERVVTYKQNIHKVQGNSDKTSKVNKQYTCICVEVFWSSG